MKDKFMWVIENNPGNPWYYVSTNPDKVDAMRERVGSGYIFTRVDKAVGLVKRGVYMRGRGVEE